MEDLFEDALKEAYSYAPVGEVILDTIEIRHPSFLDENLRNTPIRIVANHSGGTPFTALLEPEAPVDGNTVVPFLAFQFEVQLPAVIPGQAVELSVVIDDVASPFANGRRLSNHVQEAAMHGAPVDLIYRVFLASNPALGPQMRPLVMQCDLFDCSGGRVAGRAAFVPDLESKIIPGRKYTAEQFPLLAALAQQGL